MTKTYTTKAGARAAARRANLDLDTLEFYAVTWGQWAWAVKFAEPAMLADPEVKATIRANAKASNARLAK